MLEFRWVRLLMGVIAVAPFLLSVAVAVILWAAAFGFATGFPLAYLLVGFAVWVLANHFFEIIEHKAVGNPDWPVLSLETIAGARQQIGVVFAGLMLVLGAGYWALVELGQTTFALLLASVVALSLPAIAALLGVTRNLLRAVNPSGILSTVARLGADYIVLLLAAAGAIAVIGVAYQRRGFIELFAATYALLFVAYLIGRVVYDRRAALGVHAPRSPEAKLEREYNRVLKQRRGVLDHAYGIATSGNISGALAHIDRYARTESEPLSAKVWMFHQMVRWEDGRVALEFGKDVAAELGAADRQEEAAKVLVACRFLDEHLKQDGKD